MPHVDKHPPGDFCWLELGTTDQNAAKKFYGALFGWIAGDTPTGPDSYYTIFRLDGRNAAAAFTLRPEELARGIPTHWQPYIAVENADATASKVAGLGGTVLEPPFDVLDAGRMAVIRDPTGAVTSIFQARRQAGLGITGNPGSFCWVDLITRDPARAGQFYSGLFGWQITTGQNDDYLHIRNGEKFIGGIPPARHQGPNTVPHWLTYFAAGDVDELTAKAQRLGGRVYAPPLDIEHVGRMAILGDPQGAAFAVFKESGRR